MKARRLRDRLGGSIAILLVTLITTTAALVGLSSYRSHSQQLREDLDGAPDFFYRSLEPHFRVYSFSGEQQNLDPELRRWRELEETYRKSQAIEDHEAAYLTLADLLSEQVNRENGADLLLLVDLSTTPPRTVLELLKPEEGEEFPEQDPHAKRQPVPGALIDRALTSPHPRPDFMLFGGQLYMVSVVPYIKYQSVDGLMVQGFLLQRLSAPPDSTMVLATRSAGGSLQFLSAARANAEGKPEEIPPAQVAALSSAALTPETRELSSAGRHYLVRSEPLGEVGRVYFLRDLGWVRSQVAGLMVSVGGLGLLALAAGLFLSRRLAAAVTRPIERLADQMEKVGRGDLEQQAVVEGQDEVAQLAAAFNHMTGGLREREAFRKLAPEGARREIEKDSQIKLGGEWIEATIMFSDLRGFTSMSEKLSPTAVVELLNEYLQDMSLALKAHHGDINEYIGDAILGVFHDRDGVSSSVLAVRAALDMQASLDRLRQRTENETLKKIKMGVGLHTGELVEGWIGAEDRVKYGVVGDTVNLAARIQDRSRDGKHTFILVSGATREKLGNHFELDFFGDETFKGKTGTTPVWEVVREKTPRVAP